MNDLDNLYRQVIMEHAKFPKNKVHELHDHDCNCKLDNPSCGDKIELQVVVEDEKIISAEYVNEGCTISMAGASIFSDMIIGASVEEAQVIADNYNNMIDKKDYDENIDLGELVALSGSSKYLARRKCAKVATDCFNKCVEEDKIKGR